jgi:hypothetical protein
MTLVSSIVDLVNPKFHQYNRPLVLSVLSLVFSLGAFAALTIIMYTQCTDTRESTIVTGHVALEMLTGLNCQIHTQRASDTGRCDISNCVAAGLCTKKKVKCITMLSKLDVSASSATGLQVSSDYRLFGSTCVPGEYELEDSNSYGNGITYTVPASQRHAPKSPHTPQSIAVNLTQPAAHSIF